MSFRFGFHKTLFKLGKWRFGIGYRCRGATGIIMLCIYGILNLMWYMVLAGLWLTYGLILLFFVLPIKGLCNLIKNAKDSSSNDQQV